MKYQNIVEGKFIQKLNRFICLVEIDGKEEKVHLKNTGRLANLLIPGKLVYLEKCNQLTRKTLYDLVAIKNDELGIVNIDSQANNIIMKEWLMNQDFTYVKSEYTYGNSRFDFYLEKEEEKYLIEVKGCTLSMNGIGYFPDAISKRASKHIHELIEAKKQGYHVVIAFVIGMQGIEVVKPYDLDQQFVQSYKLALQEGVEVWYMCTAITKDTYSIISKKGNR